MKIGFLITARLKSTRLPLKLLLDLKGKSVFERVVDRCKEVSGIDEIILCTSTNAQDRPLVKLAQKNNIFYFLGSEEDVLQRLNDAATFFGLDYIISITGENPLFSIYHANMVVNAALTERKYDFIHLKGLPIGCAVYGIRPEALKVVCRIKEEVDTEIWGPLINQPSIFSVKEIEVAEIFSKPDLRLTTDYLEDYQLIRSIYSLFTSESTPRLLEVLDILDKNPNLLSINQMRSQAGLPEDILNKINNFYQVNRNEILEIKKKFYGND